MIDFDKLFKPKPEDSFVVQDDNLEVVYLEEEYAISHGISKEQFLALDLFPQSETFLLSRFINI